MKMLIIYDLGAGLTLFVVKTRGCAAPRMAKELAKLGVQLVLPVQRVNQLTLQIKGATL